MLLHVLFDQRKHTEELGENEHLMVTYVFRYLSRKFIELYGVVGEFFLIIHYGWRVAYLPELGKALQYMHLRFFHSFFFYDA